MAKAPARKPAAKPPAKPARKRAAKSDPATPAAAKKVPSKKPAPAKPGAGKPAAKKPARPAKDPAPRPTPKPLAKKSPRKKAPAKPPARSADTPKAPTASQKRAATARAKKTRNVAARDGGRKLNDREELFCLEYLLDLNGAKAARRAGYSAPTAAQAAARMLSKVNIQERIADLMEERRGKAKVDAQWVVDQLADIAQTSMADLMSWSQDGMRLRDSDILTPAQRLAVKGISITQTREIEPGASDDSDTEYEVTKIKVDMNDRIRALQMLGQHLGVFDRNDKGLTKFAPVFMFTENQRDRLDQKEGAEP